VRQHYEVEVELACRLRDAPKQQRLDGLYTSIYAERLERIAEHPLVVQARNKEAREDATKRQLALLRPLLTPRTVFMELGPGDCALAIAVARRVRDVFAIDVTDALVGDDRRPANFHYVGTNGVSVPVTPGTVDVAYSNQVLEHLHPDDAADHLRGIYAALAPGGRFICVTPNRLSGPWDVSRHFDPVATGLHLREYTITEVVEALEAVGFFVSLFATYKCRHLLPWVPKPLVRTLESGLERLPRSMRRRLAFGLAAVKVVGTKPTSAGLQP
jgi:SAM-dependent methyltransferase